MLSNLTSGSNNSSSKKEKVVSDGNSDSSHNLPLWKCNIDAFLNNPGMYNFNSLLMLLPPVQYIVAGLDYMMIL